MTDLTHYKRDSKRWLITVNDQNGNAVDMTNSSAKMVVKRSRSDENSESLIFKSTSDPSEIEAVDLVNGPQFRVYISADDVWDIGAGCFPWDFQTYRREGPAKSTTGSIAVTSGSTVLVGTSLDLAIIKRGDLIQLSGVAAVNQVQVTVLDVGGSGRDTDPGPGNVLTDFDGWVPESGISLEVYTGNDKTPKELRGNYTLTDDVGR